MGRAGKDREVERIVVYLNDPISADRAKALLSLPLEEKELVSYEKIDQWYMAWGGKCYVSFSGGKDSTVLAYLAGRYLASYKNPPWPLHLVFVNTGLEPEQCENAKVIIESAFSDDTSKAERIRELLKADRDGHLAVLPCKVGDKLYEVTGRKTISVYKVKAIRVELFSLFIEWDIVEGFVWQSLSGINAGEIGKTVFLTREEAEEALEAMKK